MTESVSTASLFNAVNAASAGLRAQAELLDQVSRAAKEQARLLEQVVEQFYVCPSPFSHDPHYYKVDSETNLYCHGRAA